MASVMTMSTSPPARRMMFCCASRPERWTGKRPGSIRSASFALVPAVWRTSYPSFEPTHPVRPAFFADRLYEACVPRGETLAVFPFGGNSLLWQAESGFWFRLAANGLEPQPKYARPRTAFDAVCDALGFTHIPLDGKTLRGSRGPDGTALHLVSAWAAAQRLTRAQVAVADKGNEITALPELLKVLDLKGALVTIDATGRRRTHDRRHSLRV